MEFRFKQQSHSAFSLAVNLNVGKLGDTVFIFSNSLKIKLAITGSLFSGKFKKIFFSINTSQRKVVILALKW